MRIEPVTVVAFRIFDAPQLDAITVVMEDAGPGNGRLMIECWGDAWSAYWGAMGDRTLQEFLIDCDTSYIVNRMKRVVGDARHRQAYLARIVAVVQDVLRTARVTHQTTSPHPETAR